MIEQQTFDGRAATEKRREEATAQEAQFRAGVQSRPLEAFTLAVVDGERVRVPVDAAAREAAIAEHRATRATASAARDKLDAELAAFASADELERIERWPPDRRAALATINRQRQNASPI